MTGVDIKQVAEKHAPEVVYLYLCDLEAERDRLRDEMRFLIKENDQLIAERERRKDRAVEKSYELNEMRRERDRLADALRKIAEDNDRVLHQFGDARNIARAALDRTEQP